MTKKNQLFILFANLFSLIVLMAGTYASTVVGAMAYAAEKEPFLKVENAEDGDISKGDKKVAGNDYTISLTAKEDTTVYLPASKDFAVNQVDQNDEQKKNSLPTVDEKQYLNSYNEQKKQRALPAKSDDQTISSAVDKTQATTTSSAAPFMTEALNVENKYYIFSIKKDERLKLQFIRLADQEQRFDLYNFDSYLKDPKTNDKQTAFTFISMDELKKQQEQQASEAAAKSSEAAKNKAESTSSSTSSANKTSTTATTSATQSTEKSEPAKSTESATTTSKPQSAEQAKATSSSSSTSLSSDIAKTQTKLQKRALAKAAAATTPSLKIDTVEITINGQKLVPDGSIQITGAAMYPNTTRIKGEFQGDGKTTQYTMPIHITNVGKDSIGSFGPLTGAGDVYNSVTGEKIGQIKQTGDWDKPTTGEYTGMFIIDLDKPLTGLAAFDVSTSGAGNINALSSQKPFKITFDNQFKYTVNLQPRNLVTPEAQDQIGVGQYGVDGNQGYVYLGSNTYNTPFQNLLLDAVNKAKDAGGRIFPYKPNDRKDYQVEDGSYKDLETLKASNNTKYNDVRPVVPQTNLIVTQTISIADKKAADTTIKDIVMGDQGTHTWRINDGTATTDPKLFMLTKENNPDISKGIESGITPTEIPNVPDNLDAAGLAKWMNDQFQGKDTDRNNGNQWAKSKQTDGSYVVAFNYGNFMKRTGFDTSTYFNNQLGTKSDAVQEVNRTEAVDKQIDNLIKKGSSMPLNIKDNTNDTPVIYDGQLFDNYVNTKVVLNDNQYAKVKSVMGAFVYGSTKTGENVTYELNKTGKAYGFDGGFGEKGHESSYSGYGKMPTPDQDAHGNKINTAYATNRPSSGLQDGQTIVNVYYVTKDGKQVLPSKRYTGFPANVKVAQPDPPFDVTAPLTAEYNGKSLNLYNKDDADGYLDPIYGVKGRHLIHTETPLKDPVADTLKYPEGPTGTEANYYYVYDGGDAPYSFKKVDQQNTDQTLKGAQFVVTSLPAWANEVRDLNQQILIEKNKANPDQAKINDLWKQISRRVVRKYQNTTYQTNTDDYGAVWNAIKDEILSQQKDPVTHEVIYTKYRYDLNNDGKVDDQDKELWLDDYDLIYKATSAYNGNVTFGNLATNKTYYIVELTPPTGYDLKKPTDYSQLPSDTQFRFWLGDKDQSPTPAKFQVTDPPNGELQIKKVDSQSKKNLAGAEFVFTWSKDTAETIREKSIALDEAKQKNDTAQISQLEGEIAQMTLRDYTKTSFGLNSTNWSSVWDTIKGDRDASGNLVNDRNGDGKVDDTDKNSWANDYSLVSRAVTDENGVADLKKIDLEGKDTRTLYAVEVKAPAGYALPTKEASQSDDFKITIKPDSTKYFGTTTIENTTVTPDNPSGKLTFNKVDGSTQKALPGAKFVLTTVPAWANQVAAAAKAIQSDQAQIKASDPATDQAKIDQLNADIKAQQEIIAQKVVKDFTGTKYQLNSADFSAVWQKLNQNGQIDGKDQATWLKDYTNITTGIADENGRVLFDKLDLEGQSSKDYYIVELEAPDGYQMQSVDYDHLTDAQAAQFKATITKDSQTPAASQMKVNNWQSKLTIDKLKAETTDIDHPAKDDYLTGAEYEIYQDNAGKLGAKVTQTATGEAIGQLTTTGKGNLYQQIVVNNLPFGKYILVETKAPSGRELKKAEVPFEISEKNTEVHLKVTNVPTVDMPFTGGQMIWQVWLAILTGVALLAGGLYYYSKKKGGERDVE